jgi:hypothetical protein
VAVAVGAAAGVVLVVVVVVAVLPEASVVLLVVPVLVLLVVALPLVLAAAVSATVVVVVELVLAVPAELDPSLPPQPASAIARLPVNRVATIRPTTTRSAFLIKTPDCVFIAGREAGRHQCRSSRTKASVRDCTSVQQLKLADSHEAVRFAPATPLS